MFEVGLVWAIRPHNDCFIFQKCDNPVQSLINLDSTLQNEVDSNIRIDHGFFNGYLNQIVLYLKLQTYNLSDIENKIKKVLKVINSNVFKSDDYTVGLYYDIGNYSFSKIGKSSEFINN